MRRIGPLRNYTPLHLLDRLLVAYLRRRGWVVFWLERHARSCGIPAGMGSGCWLKVYQGQEDRR